MSVNRPLVSIIIPVYNGEAYLENSIGTVFAQDYPNIELLVIEDGSTDSSLARLESLEDSAPPHVRLSVLSQENQGICAARNRGLDEAKGEYVMFMDQDDRMKKTCVSTLVQMIEEKNADLVIGGFDLTDENGRVLERWTLDEQAPFSKYRISAPWGRIFRNSVIQKHGIRYMVTKISEDFYFNLMFMSYADRIVVTKYRGYCWLYNAGSESHANMSRMTEDRNPLVMLEQLHRDMNPRHNLDEDCIEYLMTKHIVWYLLYASKGAETGLLKKMYRDCFAWLKERYPHALSLSFRKISKPVGEQFKVRFVVKTCIFLYRIGLLSVFLRLYSGRFGSR